MTGGKRDAWSFAGLLVALLISAVALLVAAVGALGVAAIGLLLQHWFDLTQWQGTLIALAVAMAWATWSISWHHSPSHRAVGRDGRTGKTTRKTKRKNPKDAEMSRTPSCPGVAAGPPPVSCLTRSRQDGQERSKENERGTGDRITQ